MLTALKLWTDWASAFRTQHTLQSDVNCAVKSSAVPKVTRSRSFNCTNLRIFPTHCQSNCAVKSSAIPKATQSRNFNCTNLRIFPTHCRSNCAVKSYAIPKATQSRNFNCTNLRIFLTHSRFNCAVINCAVKTEGKTERVCVGGGLTQRYVSRMMFGVRWRRSNIKIHVDEMCFVFCHHVRTSSAAVLAFCVLGVQVVILGRRAVRPWSRLFVSFQP